MSAKHTCKCGKVFQPAYPRQRNCGRECAQKASRSNGGWSEIILDTKRARAWRSNETAKARAALSKAAPEEAQ